MNTHNTRNYLKYVILAAVAVGTLPLTQVATAAGTIELHTTPVSDGALLDTRKVWENNPTKIADLDMVAHVGSIYGTLSVGILEFSLPPKENKPTGVLSSAKLVVSAHRVKEDADTNTLSPVDVDIYGYDDKSANGVVEYEDWSAGKKLGRWLTKDNTVIGDGATMPAFDVTAFVQAALAANKPFVGFRVQADGVEQGVEQFVTLRTAEFGEANGFCYTPKLVLDFK